MRRVVIAGLALSLVSTGCGTTAPTPPITPPATSLPPSTPPATTPVSSPSESAPPSEEPFSELTALALGEPSTLPSSWSELLTIPYGEEPEQLGTSPGGDGEGIEWGPSYGTQLPDGTWWFLDTAHYRLAHYTETGDYLGELPIPKKYLHMGMYQQWSRPLALRDGTLVMQSTTIDEPALLLMSPQEKLSKVPLPENVSIEATDGTFIYGFDEDNHIVQVDRKGKLKRTGTFVDQSGADFNLAVRSGYVKLTRPGLTLDLPVTAVGSTSTVQPAIEGVIGTDGVLNLLVAGFVEDIPGDITEVAGFVRIDATGRGLVEPVRPLSSESDPADGLRLGVRLGDSRPWLMVIDPDAVRVYRRSR